MLATATTRRLPFLGAFPSLRASRPDAVLTSGRARAVERDEAAPDRISRLALDDLELLSGEGCLTDWGLVERATLLRSGWS